MKKLITFAVPALTFIVAALVVAVGFLAKQSWFGAGDLRAFAFWSALLSLGIATGALGYARIAARWNRYLAAAVSVLAGALLGYFSTLLVWKALGPWFGAFSFPVFYCWLAGAILACVVATTREKWNGNA